MSVSDDLDFLLEGHHDYRAGFCNLMRVVTLQTIVIFVLTAFLLFYVNTHPQRDILSAETTGGKRIPLVSLPFPNMGKVALENWVSQAAVQVMTFGFNDINDRFAESSRYFTPKGWESFSTALVASHIVEDVLTSQQLITAAPRDLPVLLREGLVNDKYTWTFEVKMLLTIRSGGVERNEFKKARIVVEKLPTSENPSGVGIASWFMR